MMSKIIMMMITIQIIIIIIIMIIIIIVVLVTEQMKVTKIYKSHLISNKCCQELINASTMETSMRYLYVCPSSPSSASAHSSSSSSDFVNKQNQIYSGSATDR
jgi:hypothetical protein